MISCFERSALDIPHATSAVGVGAGKADLSPKFFLTHKRLYLTSGHLVTTKTLQTAEYEEFPNEEAGLTLLKKHTSPVTCVAINEEGWLICSCSDEEVILSKEDTLLKTFRSVIIGASLGRIFCCAVSVRGGEIWTCVAKASELVIIQSTSDENPVTAFGDLLLRKLDIVATLSRMSETMTWVQLQFFGEVFHVIGMASGNAVSLKIWELTKDNVLKMKDHRMSSQSKSIAGIDFRKFEDTEEYGLVIISPEGHCELFAVSAEGITLLNRIKVEDFPRPLLPNCGDHVQIEFRVLCARFFYTPKVVSALSSAGDKNCSDLEDLDNTLTDFRRRKIECPKMLISIATSTGLIICNVRSGETEFGLKYQDILGVDDVMILSNAKIFTSRTSSTISCVLQPFLQKHIYSFQLKVAMPEEKINEDFTLISTKQIGAKSVLRKKLKSPNPPPLKKRLSTSKTLRKLSVGSGESMSNWIRKVKGFPSHPSLAPSLPRTLRKKITTKSPSIPLPSAANGEGNTPLLSSRAVPIKPRSTYDGYQDLTFPDRDDGCVLATRLSDTFSHMRMAFTTDGTVMAVGGNTPPLITFNTFPRFEPICTYKEARRITALHFSFNNKYLLIASNDGKTEVINWKSEKELLSLKFNSKFNEHVHAQFYYLDKFVLQSEDNAIALYAFRIQSPSSISLKAGTFSLTSQQITALAAPNQFYSSTILCGTSKKSIVAFDANTEQVMLSIPNAHSKPISCIRINEAPKGAMATALSDVFLTATNAPTDTIKIWDLRTPKCVTRIGDLKSKVFVGTARPAISPCGRYIASPFEDQSVSIYDIRKVNSRVATFKGPRSAVLDISFDTKFTMLWCGCRNGKIWNVNTTH